ncbi:MAG: hypothetical protein M1365_11275, partial [Actinobacteria bacterium]|nr:hypothetical protein [Actinomycetota bacterium]
SYRSHNPENLLPARPLVLWSYTVMSDPRWTWGGRYIQLEQDPESENAQKIGLFNNLGWAAYYLKGYLFVKKFNVFKDFEYPDMNSNMETFTNKDIIEFETLGPLLEIAPGSFAEHKESWYLFKTELDENEENIDRKLLPLLGKI